MIKTSNKCLNIKKRNMLLYAHRGLSLSYPENTLPAIKNTFSYPQIAGCEFDIQITKDNKIILLHDNTLDRTSIFSSNITNIPVNKLNIKQIKQIDVGSWMNNKFKNIKVPKLGKVMKLLPPNKRYILDIKNINMKTIHLLETILSKYHFKCRQIIFLVSDISLIKYIKKKNA